MVLSGHGTLREGLTARIPDNTYVLFNAPSGCRAVYQFGLPYPDMWITDPKSFFIQMTREILNPTEGLMPTSDSHLNLPLASNIYPHLNRANADESSCYSITSPHLTESQKSRAIFTPGTEISDMLIDFNNTRDVEQPLILGVYEAPIHPVILEPLTTFVKGQQEKFDSAVFGTERFGNLLPKLIGKEKSLSALFDMLPPIPHGKKRLLFITSCRGIEYPASMRGCRAPYTRLARRYSLSLRTPTPNYRALQQMEEVPALRKAGLLNEHSLIPSRSNVELNAAKMNKQGVPQRNRRLIQRALSRHQNASTNSDYRPPGVEGPTVPPGHPMYNRHGPWF
jgi:hypothetical protein